MKKEDDLVASLFKLLAKTVWLTAMAVYSGWVLSVLWGWFAVTYLGLPALGVLGGCSVTMIVGAIMLPMHIKSHVVAGKTLEKSTVGSERNLEEIWDWVSTLLISTVSLITGAFYHYVIFPLLVALGVH